MELKTTLFAVIAIVIAARRNIQIEKVEGKQREYPHFSDLKKNVKKRFSSVKSGYIKLKTIIKK